MISWHKIYYVLSVLSVLVAYLFHPVLWDGAFYHLTALSFCFIHYSQYLQAKGKWSLFVFVVFVLTVNNMLEEMFFDPVEMDYSEILTAVIIAVIAYTHRNKWTN